MIYVLECPDGFESSRLKPGSLTKNGSEAYLPSKEGSAAYRKDISGSSQRAQFRNHIINCGELQYAGPKFRALTEDLKALNEISKKVMAIYEEPSEDHIITKRWSFLRTAMRRRFMIMDVMHIPIRNGKR